MMVYSEADEFKVNLLLKVFLMPQKQTSLHNQMVDIGDVTPTPTHKKGMKKKKEKKIHHKLH